MLQESPATFPKLRLGAPKAALPVVVSLGKATCAATIRVGLGYLEVPFVATMEARELAVSALGIPLLGLSCLKDPGDACVYQGCGVKEWCGGASDNC